MQSVAAMVSMVILEMSLTDRGKTSSKTKLFGVGVMMMMVEVVETLRMRMTDKCYSILNLSDN